MQIANYTFAGFPSPNAIRFIRDDETPQQRKDLTITRKASVYDMKNRSYSIPEYRLAYRFDTLDADGQPTGQRCTFDLTVRNPIATSQTDFTSELTDFRAFVNSEEFTDMVLKQLFPCSPCNE